MIVAVSGKTYNVALDPQSTGVPAEIRLPRPIMKKVGKGHQYVYDLSKTSNPVVLADMIDHLETIASILTGCSDEDASRDRRAILADLERIRRVAARV